MIATKPCIKSGKDPPMCRALVAPAPNTNASRADCFLVGNEGAFNQKAGMIPFKQIDNDESALAQSALLRATLLVVDYIETNGPIGLTPQRL